MFRERVSVVIPAYCCAKVIGRALESLLRQSRRPDEIIVVDDGSPDDIPSAIAPYAQHVRLIRQANRGASGARNAGIDAATGDFIAFLDADDEWLPSKLETQLDVFARHPEVGLVSSRYRVISPHEPPADYPPLDRASFDKVLELSGQKAFAAAMVVWTGVVIFRRNVIAADRFDVSLAVAEDRDLWARLVGRTAIYLQSVVTANYYEYDTSLSHSSVDRDCSFMLKMIHKHEPLLGADGVREWEARVYRRWAATYLGKGNGARAITPAFRRLCYQPLSPEAWWILAKSSFLAIGKKDVAAQL